MTMPQVKILLLMVMTSMMMDVVTSCNSAPAATLPEVITEPTFDECLDCICQVESNCRMPRPLCHMDVGSLSCGPYQIKYNYWLDARLRGGTLRGDWQRCAASFTCSRAAVRGYMDRYATRTRLGREPTCQDYARIHNGGPNGYRRSSTLGYWRRVERCL